MIGLFVCAILRRCRTYTTVRMFKPSSGQLEPIRPPGQFSGIQVMFAAILAIGLFLAIDFSGRITASQPLNDAYDRVIDELDQLRQEQADLIRERDYVRSDAYVAQWARSEGRMVRPGELLYIPVPSGQAVVADPVDEPVVAEIPPTPAPFQPDTVQLWWNLFFDGQPPRF